MDVAAASRPLPERGGVLEVDAGIRVGTDKGTEIRKFNVIVKNEIDADTDQKAALTKPLQFSSIMYIICLQSIIVQYKIHNLWRFWRATDLRQIS
ncbi:hypothetical protein CCGE531_22395 (plasmid) [Rhizobium sp. CCGE531]|nr:hypothetical protein CCGE531_22395 [Rhizobium sp. CCGE531]AYG75219.1 hypothetical protein CCGE532_21880 [Rhizobium sp. CCGE532]